MAKMNHADREYVARLAVELSNEMSLFDGFDKKFSRPEQREIFRTILAVLQENRNGQNGPSLTVQDIIAGFDDPASEWYQQD